MQILQTFLKPLLVFSRLTQTDEKDIKYKVSNWNDVLVTVSVIHSKHVFMDLCRGDWIAVWQVSDNHVGEIFVGYSCNNADSTIPCATVFSLLWWQVWFIKFAGVVSTGCQMVVKSKIHDVPCVHGLWQYGWICKGICLFEWWWVMVNWSNTCNKLLK